MSKRPAREERRIPTVDELFGEDRDEEELPPWHTPTPSTSPTQHGTVRADPDGVKVYATDATLITAEEMNDPAVFDAAWKRARDHSDAANAEAVAVGATVMEVNMTGGSPAQTPPEEPEEEEIEVGDGEPDEPQEEPVQAPPRRSDAERQAAYQGFFDGLDRKRLGPGRRW